MRLHNRVIRPGLWTDTELIRELPLTGRMYYMGLVQLAEDSGCLEDDVLAHKIHLFPGDADIDPAVIQQWRDKLVELGKAIPYESRGKRCLFLKNFHKHQQLRKPAAPELPLPEWVTWTEPYTEAVDGKEVKRNGFYAVSESHQPDINRIPERYQTDINPSRACAEPDLEPEPEPELESPPNPPVPVGEVVDYLNERAGTSYRRGNQKFKRHVTARVNDGFSLDDIKAVIDAKTRDWLGTPYAKYLRPETLFGSKFEGYLQESRLARDPPKAHVRPLYDEDEILREHREALQHGGGQLASGDT